MEKLLRPVLAELGIEDPAPLAVAGDLTPATLTSPLAVGECAITSVAACLIAAADLALARTARQPDVLLDSGHVAAAVRSEVWLQNAAGERIGGFAPLSRLWPTTDGWVRTHANYRWHRAALLRSLGVDDGPDAEVEPVVESLMAQRAALDVERVVYEAGGLAVAARSADAWRTSHEGANSSLISMQPLRTGVAPLAGTATLPASGLRVLDLTRVIAGPVGTRMLAALGADVLRVDNPHRPELALHAVDGVIGKASAVLDIATDAGRDRLHALLHDADVLATGYRPGALRRFGLEPDQVAERHPNVVVVTLSAWGTKGPWGGRRGFDSLVQIGSGIGWATSRDGRRPGALPCQLLDHATGYLMAAGALSGLVRRHRTGDTVHMALSLAGTADWLLRQGTREQVPAPSLEEVSAAADVYRVSLGDGWSGMAPPGGVGGRPLEWPQLPPRDGEAPPAWRDAVG